MTTNYRYWRRQTREVPAKCYTCSNCGEEFQYMYSVTHEQATGRNFCCKQCKIEFHYLRNQMSECQLNVLEYLLQSGGIGTIKANRTSDSLLFKIAPLIEVIRAVSDTHIQARITARGMFWHKLKRGIEV